jgi:D-alanyl-lipoteichoic acid acyltransferase DltB (MBOAT superfamily)
VQLRIDSWPFLASAALLIAVLRSAPRPLGLRVYAGISLVLWFSTIVEPAAIALGAVFLYLPLAVVRLRRNLSGPAKGALFVLQVAQLLWIRRYVDRVPWLGEYALPEGFALLGVSYMLLKQIEWVLWLDADEETPVDALEYTAFVVGFFTLLAGPVLRYREFQTGFVTRTSDRSALIEGLNRIVNGYLKAALLAPLIGDFTRPAWLAEHARDPWAFAWFLAAYPLYVYLNFAGYCDVVIGCGRLANFSIPENFDRPFLATNIQEFWQRWHMTFSGWIRVYVFFPLMRLLRTGRVRLPAPLATSGAVLVTFVLVGMWHGPSTGFLIFGLMHGVAALAVAPYAWLLEKLLGEQGKAKYEQSVLLRGVRVALCFSYLALSMLFFEREPAEVRALLAHAPW